MLFVSRRSGLKAQNQQNNFLSPQTDLKENSKITKSAKIEKTTFSQEPCKTLF